MDSNWSEDSHIISLKSNDDFDKLLKGDAPLVVDFYADWCGPCRKLAPHLIEKCKANKNFKLVKVNVDNFGDLAEKYEVGGIPHVVLIKNGQVAETVVGCNFEKIDALVSKI